MLPSGLFHQSIITNLNQIAEAALKAKSKFPRPSNSDTPYSVVIFEVFNALRPH